MGKNSHFFKANSRLGLITKPIHQKEPNMGVEDGPDEILESQFLSQLGPIPVSEFSFPTPESIPENSFYHTVHETVSNFSDFIAKQLKENEQQIVIGGDHSITLPSVLAVLKKIKDPQKLGYIHFDSHGDINLKKDSPTGNFHGMYLRPLVDTFDVPEIDSLVKEKLPTENMLFIGNLDLDRGENAFFMQKKIKKISGKDLLVEREKTAQMIKDFISQFEFLHISFDVDVLDKTEFPATGIPAEHGLSTDEVLPLLEILKVHPHISFDLAEFNPHKAGAAQSKKVAQQILLTFLQ